MSGSKRKVGGQAQPDFKRIKAKVGKKVPKAANLTETKFKAASLHVSGQSSIQHLSADAELISARGRSLPDLVSQLRHPAAAVRISAMKGLGNVIGKQSPHSLRPHLSVLIPACAKSCVDEDEDVRSCGLSVLGELIPQQDKAIIRPFISLLVAYATSALHSLDSYMRVDGVRVVKLLSTSCPSLVRPLASKILPPFVSLLVDQTVVKSSEEILQALVSLLRTLQSNGGAESDMVVEDNDDDFLFFLGGCSRNAMVPEERKTIQNMHPLDQLRNLQSFDQLGTSRNYASSSKSTADGDELDSQESIYAFALLSKLRGALVEANERENGPLGASTAREVDAGKIQLLVQAIRLLCLSDWTCSRSHESKNSKAFDRLLLQTVSLLSEIFPIAKSDTNGTDTGTIDIVNASICTTAMELASSATLQISSNTDKARNDWIDTFCSYYLPLLHPQDIKASASPALDVLCRLLLLVAKDEKYASQCSVMLERIYSTPFDGSDAELFQSPMGRRVAQMVVDMVKQFDFEFGTLSSACKLNLVKLLQRLPVCLVVWDADFQFETALVLGFFCDLARHTTNAAEDPLLVLVRGHMHEIVRTGVGGVSARSRRRSVFERYSVQLRRRFLALLVMLGSPSKETVKGLAIICARSHGLTRGTTVGAAMAEEIIQAVNAIRKTLPMQEYLGFLVASIGVPIASVRNESDAAQLAASRFDFEGVLHLDNKLRRVSQSLVRCGSAGVLKMLAPQLTRWSQSKSELHVSDILLRFRAALSILAMLSLDLRNADANSSVFDFAPHLKQCTVESICQTLAFVATSKETMDRKSSLLSPVIALIRTEMLSASLSTVIAELEKNMGKSEQANLTQILRETKDK